jgi:hypothetical protein
VITRSVAIDAEALRVLILKKPEIAQQPYEIFKVWPTDRDQAAFRAAMDNAADVPPDLAWSAIAQAHAFFVREIECWAEISAPGAGRAARRR